ncbi:MAG: OmpH family outer membrane protein [Alphaproteobacteria bacterium]
MGATAPSPKPWTRRRTIALVVLSLGLGQGRAAADGATILIVSRQRLLNDTTHARTLLKAEAELTAQLQLRVDAIKAELTAEEKELARLRPTLDREVFAARVAAFDRQLRSQRRAAQKHSAALQNAFRAERLKLVQALGPLLEEVREAHGASVVLNSDQVLASDPALDVTDEVIARFNATVPPPVIPGLDLLGPLLAPAPATTSEGDPALQ